MLPSDDKRLKAAREILELVAGTAEAKLSVELWDGSIVPLGPSARQDVRICIRSGSAFRRLLLAPNIITAHEQFAAGHIDIVGASPLEAADLWDHNKILALGRTLDRRTLTRLAWPFLFGGGAAAAPTEVAFAGEARASTASGRDDRAMIAFHYDVSNDFYALFLDPEMVYSCGHFADAATTLEEAQASKLDRICRKLQIAPGDRLLDIGCGWGGLMCHAAKSYGAVVHGVTLSREQLDYCRAKISALGLADRITVELRDYRSIEGKGHYDRIAQIEMFEHLGLENHEAHFRTVHRLLRPRGTYLHQATTRRATPKLSDYRKQSTYVKFVQRYIFPGGELDHIGMSTTNLERFGFEVHDIEAMREHYSLTLRQWERRLYERRDEAARLAGPVRTRLWLLYFAMFAKSFERGTTNVFQTLATRRHGSAQGLPLNRTI